MASRRKSDDISSLDLLIDTMCNTLGGIVFIALTLSLFSHSIKTKESETDSTTDLTQSHLEKGRLLLRQTDLEQAILQATSSITKSNQQNTNSLHVGLLYEKVDSLAGLIISVRTDISAVKALLHSATSELQESAQVEKLTLDLNAAKLETRRLQEARQRPIRMPNLQARAGLRYALMALSDNKVYFSHDFSNPLSRYGRSYFLQHVNTAEIDGTRFIVCRDDAGVDCNAFSRSPEFRMLLQNIDARREVLQIAVYPDSFASFHKIRNLLTENGLEYNWIPVEGPLILVDSPLTESQ